MKGKITMIDKKQLISYVLMALVIVCVFHMSTPFIETNMTEISIENTFDDNTQSDDKEEQKLLYSTEVHHYEVTTSTLSCDTLIHIHSITLFCSPFKPPIFS